MVEAVSIDCQRPTIGVDDDQRAVGLDAADAADGHPRLLRGGPHRVVLSRGGGEKQFVVVATVQQAFVLQCMRQRSQVGAARQLGQVHACADRGAPQDVAYIFRLYALP